MIRRSYMSVHYSAAAAASQRRALTADQRPDLVARKGKDKIVPASPPNDPMARALDSHVDLLLVGDPRHGDLWLRETRRSPST
jgi:hypothetical protein